MPQFHSFGAVITEAKGDTLILATDGVMRPHSRYVLKYVMNVVADISKNRVISSISALRGVLTGATDLVRQLLKFDERTPGPASLNLPIAGRLMHFLDFKYNLAYIWGPPGTGKTMHLANLGLKISKITRLTYFVAPTNAALLALSKLLIRAGVKHWNYISRRHVAEFASCEVAKHIGTDDLMDADKRGKNNSRLNAGVGKIYAHSRLVLMTDSRALAPKASDKLLSPECLIIDEQSLLASYKFVALLRLNPECIILSGDHMQAPPFNELMADNPAMIAEVHHRSMMVHCPSIYFGLAGDVVSPLMGRMRMPEGFSRLFGAFFYDKIKPDHKIEYGLDYSIDFNVGYGGRPKSTVSHVKKRNSDCFFTFSVNAALGALDYIGMESNYSIITPFVGQRMIYDGTFDTEPVIFAKIRDDPLAHRRVVEECKRIDSAFTMRPVQGSTLKNVYVDFVRSTNFQSLTNSDLIVALSRFTGRMCLSLIPSFSSYWFSKPYSYDDHLTINDNYSVFLSNVGSIGNIVFPLDHNATHPLKWRFFIWVLERIWAKKTGQFGSGHTAFEKLAVLRPVDPDIAQVLRQVANDYTRFKLVEGYIFEGKLNYVDVSWFQDDRWYSDACDVLDTCARALS
jgi:hypothetical protein